MQKDIQIKEAMYIEKVNSLQQELHFAHPSTLWKLNMIYNFHFTGCELWDFSSPGFSKFMSTVSKSFKILFDLPYATHKYFYEAITSTQHAALIIKKRFVNFVDMIRKSNKVAPKKLLQYVEHDVRSVTGSNIRQLLLENNKRNLSDIEFKGRVLHPVPAGDEWRIGFAFDSIDILNNIKFVPDFDKANVKQMLNDICIF